MDGDFEPQHFWDSAEADAELEAYCQSLSAALPPPEESSDDEDPFERVFAPYPIPVSAPTAHDARDAHDAMDVDLQTPATPGPTAEALAELPDEPSLADFDDNMDVIPTVPALQLNPADYSPVLWQLVLYWVGDCIFSFPNMHMDAMRPDAKAFFRQQVISRMTTDMAVLVIRRLYRNINALRQTCKFFATALWMPQDHHLCDWFLQNHAAIGTSADIGPHRLAQHIETSDNVDLKRLAVRYLLHQPPALVYESVPLSDQSFLCSARIPERLYPIWSNLSLDRKATKTLYDSILGVHSPHALGAIYRSVEMYKDKCGYYPPIVPHVLRPRADEYVQVSWSDLRLVPDSKFTGPRLELIRWQGRVLDTPEHIRMVKFFYVRINGEHRFDVNAQLLAKYGPEKRQETSALVVRKRSRAFHRIARFVRKQSPAFRKHPVLYNRADAYTPKQSNLYLRQKMKRIRKSEKHRELRSAKSDYARRATAARFEFEAKVAALKAEYEAKLAEERQSVVDAQAVYETFKNDYRQERAVYKAYRNTREAKKHQLHLLQQQQRQTGEQTPPTPGSHAVF